MSDDNDVIVRLTHDEALVLFAWAHWAEEEDRAAGMVSHRADTVAINALSVLLEAQLVEPFNADYDHCLNEARRRLLNEP